MMPELNMVPMLFGETSVRIIQTPEGLVVIPIVDIADAIEYSRQGLHQIVRRNEDVFQGWLVNVTLTSSGPKNWKRTDATALTKEAIIAVLIKAVPSRVKNPEKREKIIKFQRWAIETLTAVLDGRLTLVPTELISTGKSVVKNVDAIRRLALKQRYEHGHSDEIKAIADAEGKGIESIYRYMKLYRAADGLGLQSQPRKDKGQPRKDPEGVERVKQYLKEHASATMIDVWRNAKPDFTYATVRRIVKNLRRGK
jgi:transposase